MTPQQLMDLPYAGMAQKQLKAQGDWHKTKKAANDAWRAAKYDYVDNSGAQEK